MVVLGDIDMLRERKELLGKQLTLERYPAAGQGQAAALEVLHLPPTALMSSHCWIVRCKAAGRASSMRWSPPRFTKG